jgi:hypothetical protein
MAGGKIAHIASNAELQSHIDQAKVSSQARRRVRKRLGPDGRAQGGLVVIDFHATWYASLPLLRASADRVA